MRTCRIVTVMGIPIELHVSLLAFLPILAWRLGSEEYIATWSGVVNAISPQTIEASTLLAGSTP